jgi:hypothetical protein
MKFSSTKKQLDTTAVTVCAVCFVLGVWILGSIPVKNWPVQGCSATVCEIAYVTLYPWEIEHFIRSEKKRGSFHKMSGTMSSLPGFLGRFVRFTYWMVSRNADIARFGENSLVVADDYKKAADVLKEQGDYNLSFAYYNDCYLIRAHLLAPSDPRLIEASELNQTSFQKCTLVGPFAGIEQELSEVSM